MGCSNGKVTECGNSSRSSPIASCITEGKISQKYTLKKVLRKGGCGTVYSCTKNGTTEEYAVKMIDVVKSTLPKIKKEEDMLRKLAHPCVVNLLDVYYEEASVCMVLDIHKGGDMIEGIRLHWASLGVLPMSVVGNMVKQIIASIGWLHKNSVIHRDVKGDNYLMDRRNIEHPQCRIVLSDFGTARDLKDGDRLNSTSGTKAYWAPELYSRNYGLKVDLWATGVTMYGLLTGKFPFKDKDDVLNKSIHVPPQASEGCEDLLRALLRREESERPSASQALAHAFLAPAKPRQRNVLQKMDFRAGGQEDPSECWRL